MSDKRILVIVESPTKAGTVKSFLPSNYVVMASKGHISDIANGGSYWNTGIDPSDNFKADFEVDPEKKAIVAKLKSEAEKADLVILASDPDREGEAIAWSLRKFLRIPKAKCKRASYTEVTRTAVVNAMEHPREIDEDLVDASHARMKLDKMLGYRLSSIAKRAMGAKSVGRCQSAGLKLVALREDEIQGFVPEQYSELFLNFSISNESFKAKYWGDREEVKRASREQMLAIVKDCYLLEDGGFGYKVSSIECREKSSQPKPPFITSTFQQEVSSRLGISPKRTMEIAQRLFEGLELGGQHVGLITYMRTDSTEMADEFKELLKDHIISNFGKGYYSAPRKGKKDELSQEGHECLRVTDLSMTPDILSKYVDDKQMLKVYDIIYRRTVACSMAPARTSETTYTISIGEHLFRLVSKELLFDGYQRVYHFKDKEEDGLCRHVFKMGEEIPSPDLEVVDKETKPKPRFTEATLLKELESSGIGRPSTYATIVSTLVDPSRGYCTVEDKSIVPTSMGMELSGFLDRNFGEIINVNYTREMEESLDLIANGKLGEVEFLTGFHKNLEDAVSRYQPAGKGSKPTGVKCPECGRDMVLRNGKYGEFLGCSGYPKCKHIEKIQKEGD